MTKQSRNLTGQEHILVANLKVYVIHEKMTLLFSEDLNVHSCRFENLPI